jgi:hypothetical protein
MVYDIKEYSYKKAHEMDVFIKPSTNPKYKIDIYTTGGRYITSIGAMGYSDYPTYLEKEGKKYAEYRRALYHYRHKKEADKIGTRGWFAMNILW